MVTDGERVSTDSWLASTVFELVPVPTAIVDGSGHVILANSSFKAAFNGIENVRSLTQLEADLPDGGRFHFHNRPLRDNTHLVFATDISDVVRLRQELTKVSLEMDTKAEERRALENQFRQSQKMDAIGRLAGGIAHDFNNLLMVILGRSQMLLNRFEEEGPVRKNLELILNTGQRAAELTKQLLALSRKQVLAPRILDLHTLVMKMESMLLRLIEEDVHLMVFSERDLGRVKADASQIEQVVLNLVINARDALAGAGGQITINLSNEDLGEAYSQRHIDVTPGRYVCLSVTDTGCGMDAETQARMFEPFFTTKDVGKGTGLGLSTVYGIVQQSHGHMNVVSEIGSGTTLKIYFPRVDERVENVITLKDNGYLSGSETLLLVEDQDEIRSLVREILENHGYKILEAANGHEALRICGEYDNFISLMLTDVVMPGMNGSRLAEQASVVRPEMKVIFMSGYPDGAILERGILHAGQNFLQKPLTGDVLLRKLRDVLGPLDRMANA